MNALNQNFVTQKIINHFESKMLIISLTFLLFFEFTLCYFNDFSGIKFISVASLRGQLGLIIIFFGLLIRMLALGTKKYENLIKITGIYGLVRQPFLLSEFFIIFGLNIIFFNIKYCIISMIIYFIINIYNTLTYDKILKKQFNNIWLEYSAKTNFIIPIPYRYKDIFAKNYFNWMDSVSNSTIYTLIILFLIFCNVFLMSCFFYINHN